MAELQTLTLNIEIQIIFLARFIIILMKFNTLFESLLKLLTQWRA